ncbi:MAG: dTDP-4-dehydrorhamnose 3,5-epimerase [Planctomycetota bacterium]|jgi:dTDP-4-dehydrorhamnose 3,5-epimerase
MKVEPTTLPGVLLIEPTIHRDERGWFLETFRRERYAEHGIAGPFVQDSLSFSRRGVLRGLHLQWPRAQGKLVYVAEGEVFDVAVDVRRDSPTFRQWVGHLLSAADGRQMWIPPGFAHGFLVTSEAALLAYKCTEAYDPGGELAIRWNDPALGIEWPAEGPVLSPRDAAAPLLSEIEPALLPR